MIEVHPANLLPLILLIWVPVPIFMGTGPNAIKLRDSRHSDERPVPTKVGIGIHLFQTMMDSCACAEFVEAYAGMTLT